MSRKSQEEMDDDYKWNVLWPAFVRRCMIHDIRERYAGGEREESIADDYDLTPAEFSYYLWYADA